MARWQQGQSGNPGGRPKDNARQQLEEAIKRVEKTKKVKFFDHVVKQAYRDNAVLVALLRKVVPDLKSLDANLSGLPDAFRLILSNGHKPNPPAPEDRENPNDRHPNGA